jgi:hypothetical protein
MDARAGKQQKTAVEKVTDAAEHRLEQRARVIAKKEDGVGKDGTTNGNFFMYGSRNIEGAEQTYVAVLLLVDILWNLKSVMA